jgi:hypothetical protein
LTPFHFIIKPAFRFAKHYLLRGGILDGRAGWNYSISMAQGVYWRYVEMKRRIFGFKKSNAQTSASTSSSSYFCSLEFISQNSPNSKHK